MKNKQIALLLAGALCINGSVLCAADPAEGAAMAEETAGVEEDASSDEEKGAQEAQAEEAEPQVEETLAEEEAPIQEETVRENMTQKEIETPAKINAIFVDEDGLIEDFGEMVSDSVPGDPVEPEEETEEEDIHRGMFPGFVVDPSKYPAANITKNALKIYCFLRQEMKMTHAAACGILANVHLESNFRPLALGDGGTSYGICQWHNGRFTRLMNYCTREELDYNTLEGQLEYLRFELEHPYKAVYEALGKVEDDEDGAWKAAYLFCMRFEMPDQLLARSERRGNLARAEYFDKDYVELAEEFEEDEDFEELMKYFRNQFQEQDILEDFRIEAELM